MAQGRQEYARIEIPVDENNQVRRDPWMFEDPHPKRILVLSGLWGHGEILASLLANALGWGTEDVRYQGLRDETGPERRSFVVGQLKSAEAGYVWALAEGGELLESLRDEIGHSTHNHLVVLVTYSRRVARTAAKAWHVKTAEIVASHNMPVQIAAQINSTRPILHVQYADSDIFDRRSNKVDLNEFVDQIHYAVAKIMVLLEEWDGPRVEQWRKLERFQKLRHSTSYLRIPERSPSVAWRNVGELGKGPMLNL